MTSHVASESDLLQLLQAVCIGFWEYDQTLDRLYYSDPLRAWLGGDFPPAEGATLADWLARIHPADQAAVAVAVQGCRESNQPFAIDYRFAHRDGHWIWLQARGHVTRRDTNGAPLRLVGTKLDASEMVAARQRLAEREATLSATLNATADGILVIGDNGRILTANRRFQALWRIPDGLIEQADDAKLIACVLDQLCDPANFLAEIERLYGSNDSSLDTLQFKDGRIYERYSEALRIGGARARVWSFRDVTERDHAMKLLQAERDLFVGGPVGVLIWRMRDKWPLEYVSPNIGGVFGYSPAAMLAPDFNYADCIHPDDLPSVIDEVSGHLADPARQTWEQRYRIVLPDGGVRWIYDFTVAERDARGQAIRLRGYVMDETRQHEAALALRHAKEQLQFAIQGSGVGLWDWEVQTGRILFNSRWAEIVGYSLEEVAPISIETWLRLAHPDDLQYSTRALHAHFRGETDRYVCETRMRHKQGHWVWVLDQGQVVEWEGAEVATRKPVRMVGTHLDITQRKQLQEALERERSFLKTLIQTIPDLVWLKDPNGVYLACNPRFEKLYGTPEAGIIGKTDYDFVDAGLADFFRANDLAAAAANRPHTNEEWLTNADDGYRGLFETTKVPMWAADGSLIGILGIAHDISDIRVADLRRRQLMELSRDGIAILNQDHQVIEANKRFAEMLGYSEAEVLGLHSWDFEANFSEAQVRQAFADLSHINQTIETLHHRKDGSVYEAEVSATGASIDGSNVVITLSRDISERKAIQQELEQHREHLEALVAQRTAELIAARERAEDASRTKSTFLANMSHEIRTPMNAIIGLTHLLRSSARDAKQAEQLTKVSDAARHLLGIINDILDISKIEAGKMNIESADFSPRQVVGNVLDLIRDSATAKGIRLVSEIDPALPPMVRGDALRLGQVLLNFAGNAVKFTEQGVVTLSASVLEQQGDRLRVRFEVRDTGIGMSEGQIARLFQAFEQADTSTTRKYGGTGLGLAISKRLIGLLGGDDTRDIGVASRLGEGSRFWCDLPFELGHIAPGDAPVSASDVRTVLAGRRGMRILLAEDNKVNQEVTLALLDDVGFSADIAANGAEALQLLDRETYDLVLMDVQMPVMDGIAATRAIRARPGLRHLPIVAMTANVFEEDREQCLAAGMDDHIAKPVDPETFYQCLLKWLPLRGNGHVAAQQADVRMPPALSAQEFGNPKLGNPELASMQIPGLDPRAGLKRVNGKQEIYERLLRMYLDNHQSDMDLLLKKHAAGENEEARRLAHTLKGASGALGAVAVQAAAGGLEAAIANHATRAEIEQLVRQVKAIQAQLAADLRAALDNLA
jgi:PAS domain S-box-containing protein